MKKLTYLFLLSFLSFSLNAQESIQAHYDCANVNGPLKTSSVILTQIQSFTDTIYPRGSMLLDPSFESIYVSPENIAALIVGDTDNSFLETSTHWSLLSSSQFTTRFQQYYKGVRVEGGGFTSSYKTNTDPDDPKGPCDMAYAMSPFIVTGINTNVIPSISETGLGAIIIAY